MGSKQPQPPPSSQQLPYECLPPAPPKKNKHKMGHKKLEAQQAVVDAAKQLKEVWPHDDPPFMAYDEMERIAPTLAKVYRVVCESRGALYAALANLNALEVE